MATQTSLVARQVRLRQWAEQIHECQNRPNGMDVATWCDRNNITKANYYYRLKRVREACLDQIPDMASTAFVELPVPDKKSEVPIDVPVRDMSDDGTPVIRIRHTSGLSAEIFSDISPEMLRHLVEAFSHAE